MTDDNFEISRRKALASLGTIGVATAGAGAGTFAYFSDTESSSGNTVGAGTLDLKPDGVGGFSFDVGPIAPGDDAGSPSVDLYNDGSIGGHHLEFDASITGEGNESTEPTDSELDAEVSSEDFAKRIFVDSLTYAGTPVNWGQSAFPTLVDHPGAVVFNDMTLNRVSDPASGGRTGVLQATGTGYGISMRSGFSRELQNIDGGDVTLDWYGGINNKDSAPDEIYAVIEDTGGTRRLVYHTANYDSNSGDDNDETWRTLDVGTEMGLASGTAYNPNFNWVEIAPDSNTYPDPSSGGLTGDASSDAQANASFSGSATLEALGFGVGNYGNSKQKEVYYDDLSVGSTTVDFRPLTLYDVAKRGVADNLAGLPKDGTRKTFSADFTFDPMAGNDYQADGVTAKFRFGLAQQSSQDVL